ncbi:16S rRNA (cytosine(1402)-N(4))-methyltransferase [Candidatus Giovannonibacteria bacterium RIFCSPLOWO2_12_FULL_44_25]|uniref:Ribosomal RNA small subunit methyltransferase H n=3 Tax=Parcubacteria group TaxID=1794811 RepID=A0A837IKV0_9BACT|nr:MAG: Ribosomal RNA small subunit methyltransferase H [Parcubacteria group bacterium GW2011_GWC1_44_10]KKT59748.1 MAG: Ribosomal RNA small subunit methyltransferase H [Candidatus Giovannonibacteria bacterium GW2011_GWA1_44_25]KKU12281.1 MAG: Ribosomal RNA small subunit methyltransferase H [Candidatus Azambacteria bacterium GW2011_GWC2_45_7b]KKU29626.1 MAG: Ribosomal RNA small subunit methyltransferase H [Candidatus Giovannonibacteria bacterium GW2011_GWB1_46_20]OGF50336.1 MAG: 16S rRNA (cytos
MIHEPVLLKEIIALLNLKEGDNAIDATLDGGGHAKAMFESIKPSGKILGIDQDSEMVKKMNSIKNLVAVTGNFRDIGEIASRNNFKNPKAILFDLGLSRWHLEKSGRGFSFQKPDEPILMQFDAGSQKNAAIILNAYPETELAEIFKKFGEVRAPHQIAEKIVFARKRKRIYSVGDLLAILGIKNKKSLAKIFQALRIAVNDELAALEEAIQGGFRILVPGGKLAVISYHSLEDRVVKNFFKSEVAKGNAENILKKPLAPALEEISKNPSARSAKLRVLQKI